MTIIANSKKNVTNANAIAAIRTPRDPVRKVSPAKISTGKVNIRNKNPSAISSSVKKLMVKRHAFANGKNKEIIARPAHTATPNIGQLFFNVALSRTHLK
ncbi:hypothetical protein [Actinobaculum suis]|uniref:hypothetical protein n=1 Tax=Actinobaculum suis TaxID=1657 RepID=UPI00163C3812|nr:hypothetical protein [Actinobaculum suis]